MLSHGHIALKYTEKHSQRSDNVADQADMNGADNAFDLLVAWFAPRLGSTVLSIQESEQQNPIRYYKGLWNYSYDRVEPTDQPLLHGSAVVLQSCASTTRINRRHISRGMRYGISPIHPHLSGLSI